MDTLAEMDWLKSETKVGLERKMSTSGWRKSKIIENIVKHVVLGRVWPGVESDARPCGIVLRLFPASLRLYQEKIYIFIVLG